MAKTNVKITIFSTDSCNKCRMLKDYLKSEGVEFSDLNALDCWDELKDTGYMSAPIIKVEIEGGETTWFGEMEDFIKYLDDDDVCVPA